MNNENKRSFKELYQSLRKNQIRQLEDFQKKYERQTTETKQRIKEFRNQKVIKTSELENIKEKQKVDDSTYSSKYLEYSRTKRDLTENHIKDYMEELILDNHYQYQDQDHQKKN